MRRLVPLRWSTIHPAIQSGTLTNGTSRNRPVSLGDDRLTSDSFTIQMTWQDFGRWSKGIRSKLEKPMLAMVREPIDQRSKDRGTVDPLITLSGLSAPDPGLWDLPRSRLRYPFLSADAR